MKNYRFNLIDGIQTTGGEEIPQIKEKEEKKGHYFFYFLLVILIIVLLSLINTVSGSKEIFFNLSRLPIIKEVSQLFNFYDSSLEGTKEDRINILILGIGGENHQGPYLTDTIILSSLKPSTKKVAFLSIPRDLYVPIPEFGWRKINAAYALGMYKSKKGPELITQVINNVFAQPIHYYLCLDFSVFKEVVDLLEGIEIDVERSFTDYQYPAANFRYQVVSFQQGKQTMNGQKALQYVRSRHGTNGESNDFARSRRQQKVILAIKNKIIAQKIFQNPVRVLELYNLFSKEVETNLKLGELIKLGKIFLEINPEEINTQIITDEKNGLLRAEVGLDGAYILKPKAGNFKEIAALANNIFTTEPISPPIDQKLKNLPEENQTNIDLPSEKKLEIIVLNGTFIPQLAGQTAEKLKQIKDIEIVKIGNAPRQDYKKNVIYSTYEIATSTLSLITNNLSKETEVNPPAGGKEIPDNLKLFFKQGDILIILGQTQK